MARLLSGRTRRVAWCVVRQEYGDARSQILDAPRTTQYAPSPRYLASRSSMPSFRAAERMMRVAMRRDHLHFGDVAQGQETHEEQEQRHEQPDGPDIGPDVHEGWREVSPVGGHVVPVQDRKSVV